MDENTVTIPSKEYRQLLADSRFLSALREVGVDNWEGYSDAMRATDGYDEEDDEDYQQFYEEEE